MTQHYQKNVSAILKYCPTCGKKTMHQVNDKRVGTCTETHVFGLSKAQERREAERKRLEGQQQQEVLPL